MGDNIYDEDIILRTIAAVRKSPEGNLLVVIDDTRKGVVLYDVRKMLNKTQKQRRLWEVKEHEWPVGDDLKEIVNSVSKLLFSVPAIARAYELITMRLYKVRQNGIESIEAGAERNQEKQYLEAAERLKNTMPVAQPLVPTPVKQAEQLAMDATLFPKRKRKKRPGANNKSVAKPTMPAPQPEALEFEFLPERRP